MARTEVAAVDPKLQPAPAPTGIRSVVAPEQPRDVAAKPAAERAPRIDQQMKVLREELRDSLAEANRRIAGSGRAVDVLVDKQTRMVVVRVTDRDTGEQVRQVPPESALNITRNIDRLTGILVDRKV
jgi:flagellar protein FlaG